MSLTIDYDFVTTILGHQLRRDFTLGLPVGHGITGDLLAHYEHAFEVHKAELDVNRVLVALYATAVDLLHRKAIFYANMAGKAETDIHLRRLYLYESLKAVADLEDLVVRDG